MPRIRSHAEREARADEVKALIDEGLSLNQIAQKVGVSPQSVHKFITLRGWKTQAAMEQGQDQGAA